MKKSVNSSENNLINFLDKKVIFKKNHIKSEFCIHCSIADYLNLILDDTKVFWTTVENSNLHGGKEAMIKQINARRRGVKKGFPDILIFKEKDCFFLEVKKIDGRLSSEQIDIKNRLESLNFKYYIVRSIDDVIRIIDDNKIPTKNKMLL